MILLVVNTKLMLKKLRADSDTLMKVCVIPIIRYFRSITGSWMVGSLVKDLFWTLTIWFCHHIATSCQRDNSS